MSDESPELLARGLADLLSAHRELLLARWTRRVLEDPDVPVANRLTATELRDHLPSLLDALAATIARRSQKGGAASSSAEQAGRDLGADQAAQAHAFARYRNAYDLTSALRELSHFRAVIIELCFQAALPMDVATTLLVHAAIDEAMGTCALAIERAARHDLELERQRLEQVVRLLPVGVVVTDREGTPLLTNAAATALLPEDSEVRRQRTGEPFSFAASLRGVLSRAHSTLSEQLLISEDAGRERTVIHSAAAILDARGSIAGAVAVGIDITQTVSQARALEREAEFRDRYLSILGHDLRAPLNAISMAASLLSSADELAPGRRQAFARKISRSAHRMSNLISDVLDFARGRLGGGIPIAPRLLELPALLEQTCDELRTAHPDRVIALTAGPPVQIALDPDRMAQVFSNIVGNALKFSPEGSPVEVSFSDGEGHAVIEVHNHGTPIPVAALPSIFEPFRQGTLGASATTRAEGLGLGLFIAKEIVVAHGGTIEARSSAEEGTTFVIRLPHTAEATMGAGAAPRSQR